LLSTGHTDLLEGFATSSGQPYRARLRLTPTGECELEAEHSTETPDAPAALPVSEDPVGECPFHPECRVVETPTHYRCQGICVEKAERKSGLVMPRVVCQREVTREELQPYLAEKKTALLENFISRFGKPFKAYLLLKDTGKHGFEFPPRAPSTGRRGARARTADETEKEAAPARGRTSTRKTAGSKSSTRKTTTRKTTKATTATKAAKSTAARAAKKTSGPAQGDASAKQTRSRKTAPKS